MKTNEEYRLAAFRHFQHERDITPADIMDKALSLMREDFERKAWECSENLILGHIAKELKDEIVIGRQVNIAKTIMKSLRIGESFGFPKSETPEKFKTK
jgi:hypothetical protein